MGWLIIGLPIQYPEPTLYLIDDPSGRLRGASWRKLSIWLFLVWSDLIHGYHLLESPAYQVGIEAGTKAIKGVRTAL